MTGHISPRSGWLSASPTEGLLRGSDNVVRTLIAPDIRHVTEYFLGDIQHLSIGCAIYGYSVGFKAEVPLKCS